VVPVLLAASRSQRTTIRRAAALALGGRPDPAAVDRLIEMARDPSGSVRHIAAQGLGLTGDPAAIPVLVKLATVDKNLRVVSAAVRALRMRAFRYDPLVSEAFKEIAGTERDCGLPGGPSISDQPDHSFVLRAWPARLRDDSVTNVTYETSLCYDSHRSRIVLWGAHGRRADAPQTGQTWFYHADRSDWNRLTNSLEWPNATCCVWGSAYDPANQTAIVPISGHGGHGWVNALRVNMQHSHPWLFDARRNQWYPVKPPRHKGSQTSMPGAFDPVHAVVCWWRGSSRVASYDSYANEWSTMCPGGRASARRSGHTGGRFDPKTGRYIVVGTRSTWAFDPAKGTWTDLNPTGSGMPGVRMVYDSASDVMLQIRGQRSGGVAVGVYHVRENRWERLPAVHPFPHYGTFDIAYDAKHNVTVISGGWETGGSGEATVRETWTYRYKRVAPKPRWRVDRPHRLTVVPAEDGTVKLTWSPPQGVEVAGYRVYRGTGDRAWTAKWEEVAELKPGQTGHVDKPAKKGVLFYRVAPLIAGDIADQGDRLDADEGLAAPRKDDPDNRAGKGIAEGLVSYPVRTAPPALRWASALAGGKGIVVEWQPSAAKGVVGYHVYRSPVSGRSYWGRAFDPAEVRKSLKRITKEPVTGTTFVDAGASAGEGACEFAWPDGFAYCVTAVNAWGVESGFGPATLAIPAPPGPVRVIPWLDGRRLVLWAPARGPQAPRHAVMRQDDWNRKYAFRLHGAPLAAFGFWDEWEWPRSDRRRYYVYGVDRAGQVGIPSSGAWSHGYP
jgi:hypothetical protein